MVPGGSLCRLEPSVLKPIAALLLSLAFVGSATSAPVIKVDPAKAGWNADALTAAADYARSQKSTGFLVIDDNRIVAEANWPLDPASTTFRANFVHGTTKDGALLEDVASAQKSFIAMLAGVAIDKGLLDIAKPVNAYLGPGWSKATAAQEAAITVRNLMEMNSGLKEDFTYEAAPDAKFFYNTPVYATMKPVLEAASKQKLDDITRLWLTEPAGMSDTSWRKRPGAFAAAGNPTGLVTSPRDMARLGQLILDGGKAADGKRVISKAQLDSLFKPTVTNPAYGRLWWLNGSPYRLAPAGRRVEGPLIQAAPSDLVAALGAQDRKIYVVPSRKWVVVRTGLAAPDADFDNQLWTRLIKAAPPKR
jgi:CubicO group peptidase (beta-lactamase class C family)